MPTVISYVTLNMRNYKEDYERITLSNHFDIHDLIANPNDEKKELFSHYCADVLQKVILL